MAKIDLPPEVLDKMYPGRKNMIPIRTTERAKEIGRLGGMTKTPAKIQAAKLREIKKRMKAGQLADGDETWLLERIQNADSFSLDILNFIDSIKSDVHPMQRIALANVMIAAKKSIHGETINNNNMNLNVNVTLDEWEKRMFEE